MHYGHRKISIVWEKMTGSIDSFFWHHSNIWGQALKIRTEELRAIAGLMLKHLIHFVNTLFGGDFSSFLSSAEFLTFSLASSVPNSLDFDHLYVVLGDQ